MKETLAALKNPTWFLTLSLVVTISAIFYFVAIGWKIYNEEKQFLATQSSIEKLSEQIIYLDEVLTMSARLNAMTGNDYWEDRYNKYEPQLGLIINKVISLSPSQITKRFISETETSNNALVLIERKSFLEVQKGRLKKAQEILFSDEYKNHKTVYANGVHGFLKSTKLEVEKNARQYGQRMINYLLITIFVIFVSWTFVFFIFWNHFSRRKKIEKELLDSNEKLRLILEATGDGIYGLDMNGHTIFANPAAEKMLGYSCEEMKNRSQHTLIHHTRPDGTPYPSEECHICEALTKGSVQHVSNEIFWRKDGSSFSVEYISTPIVENKEVKGAVVSFKDITDRKQVEEKRRQSEIIVSSTTGIIALLDKEFTYLTVNPAYLRIAEKKYDQVIGKKAIEIFGEAFFNKIIKPNAERCLAGEEVHFEEWFDFPTVGKRYMEINYYPHFGVDNEIKGFVVSGKDITDRKKAEEELEKYQNHLEEMISERTQELKESQKQLLHSAKLSSLGKLTGAISHEFNNPLQGIRTAINILSKSAPSEKEASLAKAGKKECDRMAKMIRGLRDFYKPTTDKFIFIDINQCIEEVLALQIVSLQEKGIRINQQFSDKIPLIEVVEDQIKQVQLNLIQNSADSISGEGRITLTTEKQNSNIVIKIQDTGSGISDNDQKHLFEPFHSTKEGKGTGLGLSISYGIIQDHGGEIEVESEQGSGTTFSISLPVNKE